MRVDPSAESRGEHSDPDGPYTDSITWKNCSESGRSAYCRASSGFLCQHLSCIPHNSACTLPFRCLNLSILEADVGWFCHSVKASFLALMASLVFLSFSSNQSWCTLSFGPNTVLAVSVTMSLNTVYSSVVFLVRSALPGSFLCRTSFSS